MGKRALISSFMSSDLQQLATAILNYVDEGVRNEHAIHHEWHHPGDPQFFDGHRQYIAKLETALTSQGLGKFVPLPKWNPATTIPPELRNVKMLPLVSQHGWGATIANSSPGLPTPSSLANLSQFPDVASLSADAALQNWHGLVHNTVGGAMADLGVSPCAAIFWPWHAFIDDIYEDWLNLHTPHPYQTFTLHTGTPLQETPSGFTLAVGPAGDLFALQQVGTGTNSTEVHIVSAASGYQSFSLHTGTALQETPAGFSLLIGPNGDLFALQCVGTGSSSTEVHILSAASGYQQFSLQTGTPLQETPTGFSFAIGSNGDLFAIQRVGTGTNSTEIHVLSAASGYQQFSLHTGTALQETPTGFDFALGPNDDLLAIQRIGTGSHSTEVHILSKASGYQQFLLHTGTTLQETPTGFSFGVGQNGDLFALQQEGTGTGSTEVHILAS